MAESSPIYPGVRLEIVLQAIDGEGQRTTLMTVEQHVDHPPEGAPEGVVKVAPTNVRCSFCMCDECQRSGKLRAAVGVAALIYAMAAKMVQSIGDQPPAQVLEMAEGGQPDA